jgi:hypothetical protein
METRQEPVTMSELAKLMQILSYEEFEQFLRAQDPAWVEEIHDLVQEDPDLLSKEAA